MSTLGITSSSVRPTATKALVLYYSLSGVTKTVAATLQDMLGADMESIEMESPYTGDFNEVIERAEQELKHGILPRLKPLSVNLSQYDVIYLGFPIWFDTYAMPIFSLVKDHDFADKKIIVFSTFGSGGMEPAIRNLKQALPKAEIVANGFGIRDVRLSATAKELNRFLIENNYITGSVEALPAYTEMRPVTTEEKEIFDAACGDYPFPLGTPVLAGKRSTSEGVDYVYKVENNGVTQTIYVTVANIPNAKPEFTRVVR